MPRSLTTHIDSPKAVGARLRAARDRAALSQRQLAFPGCTAAYISRIEAGARVPSLQMINQLALRLDVSVFWVAAITTTVIGTAYLAEVIRSGFAAVPREEWEAATGMNFTLFQALRYVVIPQAWRVILPPTFAFFLSFIKDTALASQIGVLELTYAAKVFNNRGFSPSIAFGSVLLAYFVISYPLALLGKRMERRVVVSRTH